MRCSKRFDKFHCFAVWGYGTGIDLKLAITVSPCIQQKNNILHIQHFRMETCNHIKIKLKKRRTAWKNINGVICIRFIASLFFHFITIFLSVIVIQQNFIQQYIHLIHVRTNTWKGTEYYFGQHQLLFTLVVLKSEPILHKYAHTHTHTKE